jgi:hypothetical protein
MAHGDVCHPASFGGVCKSLRRLPKSAPGADFSSGLRPALDDFPCILHESGVENELCSTPVTSPVG